jgi:hypothetical protein
MQCRRNLINKQTASRQGIDSYCLERTTTVAEMNDRVWSGAAIDQKTLRLNI